MPRGRDYPVKELRQRLGLTQFELAVEVGVTPTTIARWERGESKPTKLAINQMEALARKAARRGEPVAAA